MKCSNATETITLKIEFDINIETYKRSFDMEITKD